MAEGTKAIVADLVTQGLGLDVKCHRCGHTRYLTPLEACLAFGENSAFDTIARRCRCARCGERGRSGMISARFSITDYYARLEEKGIKVGVFNRPERAEEV